MNSRGQWLAEEQWRDQHCSRVVLTPMPGIWSDLRATKNFKKSFFADLEGGLASSERKHRVHRILKDRLQLDEGVKAAEIEALLNAALEVGEISVRSFWVMEEPETDQNTE